MKILKKVAATVCIALLFVTQAQAALDSPDPPSEASPTGGWRTVPGTCYACGTREGGSTMYCCQWEPDVTIGPAILYMGQSGNEQSSVKICT